jgi:hypothetical protein
MGTITVVVVEILGKDEVQVTLVESDKAVKTFFVESVMGVGGLHEGLTSEMDRVRDVCGVPSSRVGYGSEDTVPWPIPVDE